MYWFSRLLQGFLLLVFLTTISLIGIPLLLSEGFYLVKAQINKFFRRLKLTRIKLGEMYMDADITAKAKDAFLRCWPILVAVILSVSFFLSGYDMPLIGRMVASFSILLGLSWLAGRALWPSRTKDLDGIGKLTRSLEYTVIICACAFAAATASL